LTAKGKHIFNVVKITMSSTFDFELTYPQIEAGSPGFITNTPDSVSNTTLFTVQCGGSAFGLTPVSAVGYFPDSEGRGEINFSVILNKNDGSLVSGVDGWDLEAYGTVVDNSITYDGLLLRGNVIEIAIYGSYVKYRFSMDSSSLLSSHPNFSGKDVGILLGTGVSMPGDLVNEFEDSPSVVICGIDKKAPDIVLPIPPRYGFNNVGESIVDNRRRMNALMVTNLIFMVLAILFTRCQFILIFLRLLFLHLRNLTERFLMLIKVAIVVLTV
jgi:hypothetical protein